MFFLWFDSDIFKSLELWSTLVWWWPNRPGRPRPRPDVCPALPALVVSHLWSSSLRICWDWDIKFKYSTPVYCKSAVATKFSCKFILHHVVNRAYSRVHPIAKNSLRLLGGPFQSPQTPYPYRTSLRSVRPDFSNKVRPDRQSRPAEESGLRPSALASRPPALGFLVKYEDATMIIPDSNREESHATIFLSKIPDSIKDISSEKDLRKWPSQLITSPLCGPHLRCLKISLTKFLRIAGMTCETPSIVRRLRGT